jgi:hypothetical protein
VEEIPAQVAAIIASASDGCATLSCATTSFSREPGCALWSGPAREHVLWREGIRPVQRFSNL